MHEKHRRSLAGRRFRTSRVTGASTIALAITCLFIGGEQTTHAKPPAQKAKAIPVPPSPPPIGDVMVVEAGRSVGLVTPEKARRDGLTVIDLSDEWLPPIFSEEPGKPQPIRPYLIDLANGRLRGTRNYARAREDRHYEAFGIFSSLNLLRKRLADRKRHACHDKVADKALEEMSPKSVIFPEEPEKPVNPTPATDGTTAPAVPVPEPPPRKPLSPAAQRAVIAMQAHLRCEGLLPPKAKRARMDRRTADGLNSYQRLHMLANHSRIESETRAALLADSREHDFRALLRALRERVIDATGLLEDGSALGVLGQVQGRLLDTAEFQPLPVQAGTPNPDQARPEIDAQAKITPAPDLIAAATQAASQALGWSSPEAVLASTLVVPPTTPTTRRPARKTTTPQGPLPLPAAVAIRLPPPPPYHSPNMQLRAEIDRGEVVLARPKFDKDGKKKWKPPVSDRPTLTVYARAGEREVALFRWPTTIGGWKTIEKADGSMALKFKESVTGDAIWPAILATPTWHPSPGMPTRKLLIKRGDTFEPKTEIIGPGYRAAYGLVAIVHNQIEGVDEHGEPQLVDHRIRTHGTPAYRSVKRGESSGCHRLHNHLALRLAGFLIKHRAHVRQGLVPEDYVRRLEYKGQAVALESEYKGYRFELTPPVPVTVLDGDIRGNAKSVKSLVPLNVAP